MYNEIWVNNSSSSQTLITISISIYVQVLRSIDH